MGAAWLKCQLKKGMFSNEFVVCYPPTGSCVASSFVPKEFVKGRAGKPGKVRVLSRFERGEGVWVTLPTEDQLVIKVHAADVTSK